MVVLSLSDCLTNRAQESKRAIARIDRLQATLGARSTFSKQSSSMLQSVINLMMRREFQAIIAPAVSISARVHRDSGAEQASASRQALTARNT